MAECETQGADLNPKILVIRFSAMGDCIMASWALTGLRQALPESQITWAVQDRFAPVIDRSRLVDRVIFGDTMKWKSRRWAPTTWANQLRMFAGLRKEKFDVAFDLQGQAKTSLCLKLCGAKIRLATQGHDKFAKRLNPTVDCLLGSVHEVEATWRLLNHWHECQIPNNPYMPPSNNRPNDQIVIQTGSGHPHKKLSQERWVQVAKQLINDGFAITAIGGANDDKIPVEGVTDHVGNIPLERSLDLVANCKLHVSADTGTAHAASAYGIPTVTIFGRTDPRRYQPYGPVSTVLRIGPDPNDLTAHEICQAVHQQLGGRSSASSLVD